MTNWTLKAPSGRRRALEPMKGRTCQAGNSKGRSDTFAFFYDNAVRRVASAVGEGAMAVAFVHRHLDAG